VKQQLGRACYSTSVLPRLTEVFYHAAITAGKDVVTGVFAFDEYTEQCEHRVGHDHFAAFAVLGCTRLQADYALC
jgi:hypothetical protein